MPEYLSLTLANTATFIALLPCLVAILRWKNAVPSQKIASIWVWGSAAIGLGAYGLAIQGEPNLYLLHLFIIFDFILLTLLFRPLLNPILAKVLLFGFPILAGLNSIFIEHLVGFNVVNRSVAALIIICYTLTFFLRTLREMKIQRLELVPLFWISVGALFYYAASFFIFLFSATLLPYTKVWATYFGVHAIFTILLYLSYTVALWIQPKT